MQIKSDNSTLSAKLDIRRVSDEWGEYNCTSHRNESKTINWLFDTPPDSCDITIYFDNHILKGFSELPRIRLGWLLETREINENIIAFLTRNQSLAKAAFTYIFTCLDELVLLGPPFAHCLPNAAPWIYPHNRRIHEKSRLVSMIASSKASLKGHRDRLAWVERLRDKVDLYGIGRERELPDKEDGLRDYMFSVAIENGTADTYFSEKLTDNFVMGTVPIYLGCRKAINTYFDSRGVIFLQDDPDLSSISRGKYEDMMPYIRNNFNISMQYPIGEDYVYEKYIKTLTHR